MAAIPTVKIKSAKSSTGYLIINKHDFDASKHEVFETPEMLAEKQRQVERAAALKAPAPPSPPAPANRLGGYDPASDPNGSTMDLKDGKLQPKRQTK